MYPTQTLNIQEFTEVSDGIGGYHRTWTTALTVNGYLDLICGTDLNNAQNAFVEESTHLLIIPEYTSGIKKEMRVVDSEARFYEITYSDDPLGVHHHNEIYLTYGGVLDDSEV